MSLTLATLLADALLRPDADRFGGDPARTYVETRHVPSLSVPHAIIGDGPVGGSWNGMAGDTSTLSPGCWMELPGLRLEEDGVDVGGRIDRGAVGRYYRRYRESHWRCGCSI